MLYPLAIGAACVVTSIIGTFFVRLGSSNSIMGALYKGFIATGILSLVALYPITSLLIGLDTPLAASGVSFSGYSLFWCGVTGLVVTTLIVVITEYYTGTNYRPVQSIAKASVTGHGTNVIQGLAISLEATALPALVIIAGIIVSFNLAGLYGIAIAVTTMLALAGMVVALDAFGPVTDNAGGIAEMADLPPAVRKVTDALDAVGNTTKAVTKGYAIGSAGLGALVLFAAYTQDLKYFVDHAKLPGLPPSATSKASTSISRCRTPMSSSACCSAVCCPSCLRHGHDGGGARGQRHRRGSAPAVQGEARHPEGHR